MAAALLAAAAAGAAAASPPAFPGAEGYGADTPGGRGGRVVTVTTLADSGPGSLREALTLPEARIVVFAVAGTVHLESPIYVGDFPNVFDGGNRSGEPWSFLTVAGQTAPGGGITVADYGITFANGVHDVVLRHLRFRNARRCTDLATCGFVSFGDGVDFFGASRVVLDHLSFSWATDENTSGELGTNVDITVQDSIVAEVLWEGGHPAGVHSRAMLWSRGADRISVLRNLFHSNNRRNPRLIGNNSPDRAQYGPPHPVFDFRNNLVHNWGEHGVELAWGARANVVRNLFLHGPDTDPSLRPISMLDDGTAATEVFLEGNDSNVFGDADQAALVAADPGTGYTGITGSAFPAPAVAEAEASELPALLERAGALPHDAVDQRILLEVATGAGSVGARNPCAPDGTCPDGSACGPGGSCPPRTHADPVPDPAPGLAAPDSDGDALCDKWERRYGLSPIDPLDAATDPDGDGYTLRDDYLAALADHGGMGASDPDLDLLGDFCDVCPEVADPAQQDADGDSVGDACDPCATLAGSQTTWEVPRLLLRRIDDGEPANDRLVLRGRFVLPDPAAAIDPEAEGLLFELRDALGRLRHAAALPPGAYTSPGPGWTANGRRTRFTFRDDRPGGTAGFTRAVVRLLDGGEVYVRLRAVDASLGVAAGDAPFAATVVLGSAASGALGHCGELRFAPGTCTPGLKGTRVTCR